MLSNIAAFFWGSPATAAQPHSTASPNDTLKNESENIKDSVLCDVITDDVHDCLMSVTSASDDEAGWVFVSSHLDSNTSERIEPAEPLEPENFKTLQEANDKEIQRRSSNIPNSRTSSRNLPNSVLHTSSVLNALAIIRPQQKAQRRQQELRLKHKQMERSNLVREVSGCSNRPRKRNSRYTPTGNSRAVNNRKC